MNKRLVAASALLLAAAIVGVTIFFNQPSGTGDSSTRSASISARSVAPEAVPQLPATAAGNVVANTSNTSASSLIGNIGANEVLAYLAAPAAAPDSDEATAPKPGELPFESALLNGNVVSGDNGMKLLNSAQFDATLSDYERQAARDKDAAELTALYRSIVQEQIAKNRIRAQLQGFVCGAYVCIGSLAYGTEVEYTRWTKVFFKDPRTAVRVFMQSTQMSDRKQPLFRFIFTTGYDEPPLDQARGR